VNAAPHSKQPRILAILLNWNGKKDTLECLASLKKISYPYCYPLVVDNGSTDDSVTVIRAAFPEVSIIKNKENVGFAAGNNVGLTWALKEPYEWILLLNNDTIVAPDFLERFLESARAQPNAKILGAKIYRYDIPHQIDHLGGTFNSQKVEFESHAQNQLDDGVSFEAMEKVDYVCGAALFMHRSVPETIGLLEPRYFLFWEETDYCYRAQRAGFEVWTAPQAKIWHKVSASFSGGKPHMHYFWWRSRLLWIERNLLFAERKKVYRKVIFPELWKMARHYLLRSIQSLFFRNEKTIRYEAGLCGALHYVFGKFGNCPRRFRKRKQS